MIHKIAKRLGVKVTSKGDTVEGVRGATPPRPLPRKDWTVNHVGHNAIWSGAWILSDNVSIAHLPPIPSRTGERAVALVIPFCDGDLVKLENFFASWNLVDERQTTAKLRDFEPRLRCVLAYSGDLATKRGRVVEQYLMRLWRKYHNPLVVHTLSLMQPSIGHYDGAAMSFYSMFRILGPYFKAFQIVETDTLPVAKNWTQRLLAEASDGVCERWWQKGSAQRCNPHLYGSDLRQPVMIDWNHDFHINGNALYALGCPQFDDYLRRVQLFYPPRGRWGECDLMGGCETGLPNQGGYDHCMFQYRMAPINFAYAASVQGKFIYSDYILNMCEDEYNKHRVTESSPRALFVHSKFHMYAAEEQLLRRIFSRIVRRYPRPDETVHAVGRLQRAELDRGDIISGLCSSLEYASLKVASLLCLKRDAASVFSEIFTAGGLISSRWNDAFGDKPYVFSVDNDVECSVRLWTDAGAVVHARDDEGWSTQGRNAHSRIRHFISSNKEQHRRIDAYVCSTMGRAASLCAALGKSTPDKALVAYVKDARREDLKAIRYLEALRSHRGSTSVVMVVNTQNDRRYIHSHTGYQPIVLPQWCGGFSDTGSSIKQGGHGSNNIQVYLPTQAEFLVVAGEDSCKGQNRTALLANELITAQRSRADSSANQAFQWTSAVDGSRACSFQGGYGWLCPRIIYAHT